MSAAHLHGSPRAARALLRVLPAVCLTLLSLTFAESSLATQPTNGRAHRSQQRVLTPPPSIQTTVLRYTGLQALPARLRQALSSDATALGLPPAAATDACSRPLANVAGRVEACLGLRDNGDLPSSMRIRFDLALKSIGAPKEVFNPCPAGAAGAVCNPTLADSFSAQQRLADLLAGQRRYPFATLGLALSF